MSDNESTEPLGGRQGPSTLAKVVGQVNDVRWQQQIVLTKPTTMPASGADEIAKLLY